MSPYFHSVTLDESKCKGCTNCIKRCPTEAIRVRKSKARIINERCIDCGECIRVCPYHAKKAITDKAISYIADKEGLTKNTLVDTISKGKAVVLKHRDRYLGIGEGLRTKINANIGTSPEIVDVKLEMQKLKVVCDYGADTVMDLSTGGDIKKILTKIINNSPVPVGTVPIYQAAVESIEQKGSLQNMASDKIFEVIENHARAGVSFVTVHCGITLELLERLRRNPRKSMVVSRGGAFLISWMIANGKENPLYESFDRLLEISRKYGLVLSLGDGMRPGV